MSDLVAAIDDALVRGGEEIILRRTVGTTNRVNIDVRCVAAVRSPSAHELVGEIKQDDLFCIISPSQINAAQWPGGQLPTTTSDLRIPNSNLGDNAYVRGRWRQVQWGQGFYPGGELCRIEMRVSG